MSLYDKAFWIALAFIIGSSVAIFYQNYIVVLLVFITFELFLIALSFEEKRLLYISLFLLIFGPAYFYGSLWVNNTSFIDNQIIEENLEVTSFPEERQSYVYFKGKNEKGLFHIYTEFEKNIDYRDKILVSGTLSVQNDYLSLWKPKINIIEKSNKSLNQYLFNIRNSFVSYYESLFLEREAALISGLTFGDRRGFSTDFKEKMSKSGTTHIVALSGYNITILASVLGLIFMYFFSRKLAFILTVIGIILFTIMVGAEASIVRASIMGIIALLSIQVGREYALRNAIILSALVMILINPLVIKDIGFQFSFMALIGIVYIMPILSDLTSFDIKDSFMNWKGNLLTTFSAQIMVLPLILFHFGIFSWLSIVANIFILEAVPIAMFFGFLIAGFSLLGQASYLISLILSVPTKIILDYQIFIIDLFSKFNFATIEYNISIGGVIIFYILIIGFILLIKRSLEVFL
ncbi:MAG: hypothetical protein COV57_00735 [Candidatus Liptonbacteria bacterium CG11_big_fil_rev_8_21_14_0_20_35_14]|uniref:ComEC/Rec2-related protein domain-containing protein n=1 Tax=Candidatus Liptonbacteria bacterium CG11_big_fil_rev_8_21_14_0_20_35_14 TaxID=1974634 RepID=A0A2H0NAK0_9BACT|nr:MAG: hypothetical protein COV57_00735 [Candidatus Liptonbacteria bacterium CG11_big_fil_rev_8_21_14_0_20_35_14]